MSVRTTVKSIQDIMRQDTGVDGDAQRISQLCWMFFLKIIGDQDQELELTRDDYRSPLPKKYQWRTWAANPEGITGEELMVSVNGELFPALKSLAVSTRHGDRRRVVKDVFEDAYNYMKSGQLMRQVVNKINEVDFNNLAERPHFGDIYEQVLNDLQSAGNAGEYYTPRAVTAFMVDRSLPGLGQITPGGQPHPIISDEHSAAIAIYHAVQFDCAAGGAGLAAAWSVRSADPPPTADYH